MIAELPDDMLTQLVAHGIDALDARAGDVDREPEIDHGADDVGEPQHTTFLP